MYIEYIYIYIYIHTCVTIIFMGFYGSIRGPNKKGHFRRAPGLCGLSPGLSGDLRGSLGGGLASQDALVDAPLTTSSRGQPPVAMGKYGEFPTLVY